MTTQPRMAFVLPAVDIRFCTEIGKLIVCWGTLERMFNDLLQRMFIVSGTVPEKNWRRLDLEKRFTMLKEQNKLCFGKFPKIQEAFEDIQTKMASAQIDRNLLAHGEYRTIFPGKPGPIKLKVLGRQKAQDVDRIYSREDILNISNQIMEWMGRLSRLTADDVSVRDLPDTPPQELSALRDFVARSRAIPPKPNEHQPQPQ